MDSVESEKLGLGFRLCASNLFWGHIYEALPTIDIIETEDLFRLIGFLGQDEQAPDMNDPVTMSQLRRLFTALASPDRSYMRISRNTVDHTDKTESA